MKTELKFLFMLCVLIGLFAGCSDEVTRPQLPQVDQFTVDATVDQTVVTAGHFVTPHVDGRGGTAPYSFRWYQRNEWIGVGEEPAPQQMNEEGFYTFLVVGIDSLGTVAQDSVVVTVLPAEVDPLTVDATATHMESYVGDNIRLHADARGGVRPYQEYYWYLDDQNIGVGEEFNRPATEQGVFTFVVVVYDALGTTASDSVTVTVTAPNTVEWCASTNLVVRSNARQMTESMVIGHRGDFNLRAKLRFDVNPRKDAILRFNYSDGSVRFATIPDMVAERPALVWVDLGVWRIEELQSVTLYLTTDPSKCDGTVRLLELCGSTTLPSKAADGIPVIRLGKDGNYTLVE